MERHEFEQLIRVLEERNEIARIANQQTKEQNQLMSSVFDSLGTALQALLTDDEGLRAQVTDLQTQLAATEAQIATLDPNASAELAAAQTQIQGFIDQINALLNPTPPPVDNALAIADQTVTGAVNAPISVQVVATGGTAPYTFSVENLDQALALDALGNLSGTPSASSTAQVSVTDAAGGSAGPATLTITVS